MDFLDADSDGYRRAGEALLETGVTAYLPTFITAPEEQLHAALREVPRRTNGGPRILGVHVEGPFLAPKRLGTHPPLARRDPDPALLERLLDVGPDPDGDPRAGAPGRRLPSSTSCSGAASPSRCGHTDATAEEANAAFDAGVRTVTHLFNAMRPFRHRDPGIAGAALARTDVVVQIILDGIHLAPETAKLVWSAAAGRVALVTDAVAGAGLDDGSYSLGGFEVKIRDGVARGPDGVLAGSSLTMIEAVQQPARARRSARQRARRRVVGSRAGDRRACRRPRRRRARRRDRRRRQPDGGARARRGTRTCRCLSPSPRRIPSRRAESGATFLAEIREQPAALSRLLEHGEDFHRVAALMHARGARDRADGRATARRTTPRLSASTPSACALAGRRSATRSRSPSTTGPDLDFSGSTVLALSQSGRTPDVLEYVERARAAGRLDGCAHERARAPSSPQRPKPSCRSTPGASKRSRRPRPT